MVRKTLALAFIAAVIVPAAADGPVVHQLDGAAIPGSERFGSCVVGLGDLDGDGTPDFAVGDPWAERNGKRYAGALHIFSGKTRTLIATLEGRTYAAPADPAPFGHNDHFGSAAASIGDVTGDAVPDFVVSAPGNSRFFTLPGYVRLYSGADRSLLGEVVGAYDTSYFGETLAGIGDVDNDGTPDFAVGEPGVFGTSPGAIRVFSGAPPAAPDQPMDEMFAFGRAGRDPWDNMGRDGLAGVGDLTGDGVAEYAIGIGTRDVKGKGAIGPGEVIVVEGGTGKDLFTVAGKSIGDWFGGALAGVGDVNGDGVPDFAVGIRGLNAGRGGVTVISGKSRKPTLLLTGTAADEGFGSCVAAVGDVNGDGLPDLVVGAETGDGVYTVWGKSTNNAGRLHCTYRAGAGDDLGEVVAGTGDVTGDGIPDFLVGAWSNGFARVVGATAGSGTGGGPLTFPKQKVKAPLTRPATGALASGASGTLTIQTKGAKASLKLVLRNMPADGIYSVWLEDGVGAGTYTSVATIQVATGRGSVTISAEGQIPPELGVTDLADLVGRRAEVRDASGAVVLGLAIPSFLPLPTVKRKGTLTPVAAGSKASAAVKIAYSGGKSTDRFSVKAKKVDKGLPLRVWLETAVGSGTFADAGAMLGRGKYRRDTKKGDPLPLGVTSVTHLSGRKIQVRNGSEVLLSGVIP